jgi:acetylornithine deacetylase
MTLMNKAMPNIASGNSRPSLNNEMIDLLRDSIRIKSISGRENEFAMFMEKWARNKGFETDLFDITPSYPEQIFPVKPRHLPLAGRPALIIKLKGKGNGKNIIFNAHSDTVSEGEMSEWTGDPFSGDLRDGRIYGRGACDTKGPLVSALWAMCDIKENHPEDLGGDIILEIIPGEEDCVGIGTIGSVNRGYRADASIILEPTENIPRNASRAGIRFLIKCGGQAIHGTVKWLGKDAILSMRKVLDSLDLLQERWNDRQSDIHFASYPYTRPVTVDTVHGGQWQGMICDNCMCAGYFELLPGDDISFWQNKFSDELRSLLPEETISVEFSEIYHGHHTQADSAFCATVESVMLDYSHNDTTPQWNGWSGFNSGCESGVRTRLHNTPTIIWGPGSVEQAHSPNEYIELNSIALCAEMFKITAMLWLK